MKRRLSEVLAVCLCLVIAAELVFCHLLFSRLVSVRKRISELQNPVIRKARLPLTEKQLFFMIRGMSTIPVSVRCDKQKCTASFQADSFDYSQVMQLLTRLSQLFRCNLTKLCIGEECNHAFSAEVEIYALNNSG